MANPLSHPHRPSGRPTPTLRASTRQTHAMPSTSDEIITVVLVSNLHCNRYVPLLIFRLSSSCLPVACERSRTPFRLSPPHRKTSTSPSSLRLSLFATILALLRTPSPPPSTPPALMSSPPLPPQIYHRPFQPVSLPSAPSNMRGILSNALNVSLSRRLRHSPAGPTKSAFPLEA